LSFATCLVALYHQALSAPLTCQEKEQKIRARRGNILQWKPRCTEGKRTFQENPALGYRPKKQTRGYIYPVPNRIVPLKPGQTQPDTDPPAQLPESYNTTATYRSKCPGITHVLDQGKCGNCWAAASISMINDRVCMYSQDGVQQQFYSWKQLTTCVSQGCNGSHPSDAFNYWQNNGLTTGGVTNLGEPSGCLPYPNPGFPDPNAILGAECSNKCDDGSDIVPVSKGSQAYQIQQLGETAIMNEIYLYGPVVAGFTVYEDFMDDYSSGVYYYAYGKSLGGHAVKITGWGVENGVNYWLIQNSWGTQKGIGGYYKIQRGTNEVNIESDITAAVPVEGLASEEEEAH